MMERSNAGTDTMRYLTPEQLTAYLKILVKLEIIMTPKEDDWLRIAGFSPKSNDIESFFIDNGAGDRVTIYRKGGTAIIKGFDHESGLSPYQQDENGEHLLKQIYAHAPMELIECFDDESRYETTFAMWNLDGGDRWHFNKISDEDDGGRKYLLGYIHTSPQSYLEWAEAYHEVSLDVDLVSSIYEGKQIHEAMIITLNPNRDVQEALEELAEIDRVI